MQRESQQEYFARRAREEHVIAEAAEDPKIAELHLELAVRYEQLADSCERPLGRRTA